jgi:hypothetical protein
MSLFAVVKKFKIYVKMSLKLANGLKNDQPMKADGHKLAIPNADKPQPKRINRSRNWNSTRKHFYPVVAFSSVGH